MPAPTRGASWRARVQAPGSAGVHLLGTHLGWPPELASPSPALALPAVMAGVNAASAEPAWGLDPSSLRLTEAGVALEGHLGGPWLDAGATLEVVTTLTDLVDLGSRVGLRLALVVTGPDSTPLARADLTIAATGDGLSADGRPGPREPSPAAPDPATAHVEEGRLDQAAVDAYCAWVGDRTAFHHDPAAATAAGLDGPVVPGLLVLARLASTAAGTRGGLDVAGVGARFVRPALVGDELDFVVERPVAPGRHGASVSREGVAVVRRAWIDWRRPFP